MPCLSRAGSKLCDLYGERNRLMSQVWDQSNLGNFHHSFKWLWRTRATEKGAGLVWIGRDVMFLLGVEC